MSDSLDSAAAKLKREKRRRPTVPFVPKMEASSSTETNSRGPMSAKHKGTVHLNGHGHNGINGKNDSLLTMDRDLIIRNLDDNNNASAEGKFHASVEVIHRMPKTGPFQASNMAKLKFYGLYKQATCGPCVAPKPGFWSVVERAKWEAWMSCGEMSKIDAMQQYIDELKEMVLSMMKREDVKEFVKTADPSVFQPMFKVVGMNKNGTLPEPTAHARSTKRNAPDEESDRRGNNGSVNVNNSFPVDFRAAEKNAAFNDDNNTTSPSNDKRPVCSLPPDGTQEGEDDIVDAATTDEDVYTDAAQDIAVINDDEDTVLSGDECHKDANGGGSDQSTPVASNGSVSKNQAKRTSGRKRRAVHLMGSLLRDTLKTNGEVAAASSPYEELYRASWESIEQLQRERQLRRSLEAYDAPLIFGKDKHRAKKGRGRRDSADNTDGDKTAGSSPGNAAPGGPGSGGAASSSGALLPTTTPLRGGRQSSGSSEETSSGESMTDAHVTSVLFRMHRQLQQISRQLDLLEGILITQQRLIHATLDNSLQPNRPRLFSNMTWRTVLFVVSWPVVVHFAIRLLLFWYRRRRNLGNRSNNPFRLL